MWTKSFSKMGFMVPGSAKRCGSRPWKALDPVIGFTDIDALMVGVQRAAAMPTKVRFTASSLRTLANTTRQPEPGSLRSWRR